ncbi:MAG: prolyl oligopeptidase family serine peptidase, partial [Armatimonadota bacterium]
MTSRRFAGRVCAIIGVLAVLAALCCAALAQTETSPGDWLTTDGKGAGWIESTAVCRELLGRLQMDSALVRDHLPRVRDWAQLLRRVESFDWKTRTAIDFLENMLTDLIAGQPPNTRYAGKGLGFAYWSDTMGRVEAIWVHVPPGYDPTREYQLFMYYKCGGGIHYKDGRAHGGYRPDVGVANQTDTFHAWSSLSTQVKGRLGAVHELREATAALARDFAISPDRVFLTGWSDGGFTALWLASRHPHLVAGIAPACANWQYANVEQIGLNTPMLVVDGWTDGGYNRGQFVRWHTLAAMGYDVAGIWGHHGHSYQPYEDPTELKQILDWAKTKRRNLWPKRVRYATWNLQWHRAYWLSIERMVNPALVAQIDAEVKEGNRIEVRTWNVAAYELALGDKLVDPGRPVEVITNGRESYSGAFRRELTVELGGPPGGKYVKDTRTP